MNKITPKKLIGLVVFAVVLVGMHFLPTTETLTAAGRNALGVLIAMLALLISEALPIGVTCIVSPVLLVVFGCVPVGQAFSGFANHIMFFVLASFGISAALTKVNLSRRLLKNLMLFFGKNVKLLMLAMMICVALVSSVISNVAAAAVFMPIMLGFLNIYDKEEDRKKTGRAFMLGLPIASMIGGMMTPAGSSLNLLCISQLEAVTGMTVTFTQWMLFGIPVTMVMLPLAWFIITRFYKPAEMSQEAIRAYVDTIDLPQKLDKKELFVAGVMIVMFVLWVLSSWFPKLNVTVVAVIGFTVLMLPSLKIMSWKEYEESVSWSAFFLLGAVMSVGGAVVATGASGWLTSVLVPASLNLPVFGVVFIASLIIFVLLVPVPVAPALIAMLAAPLFGLASGSGLSPVVMCMVLGLCVANCYLLPLDTVPLITYNTGYYKMGELAKCAAPIQIFMAVFVSIWLPLAALILRI